MPHFVDTPHVPLYPPIIPDFTDTFDPDTAYYNYLSLPSASSALGSSSCFWTANMPPKGSQIKPETPQKRRPIIAVSLRPGHQTVQIFTNLPMLTPHQCQRCRKRKIKCDPGEDGAPCLTCKQGNVSDSCKYFRVSRLQLNAFDPSLKYHCHSGRI